MSKTDTLIIGVLYPAAERYAYDYIESINLQNDTLFDILILNNKASIKIKQIFKRNLIWQDLLEDYNPSEIRFQAITYGIKQNYKNIIFTDLDDYFSKNRVAISKKALEEYDFAYNEMDIINEKKQTIQKNILSILGIKSVYSNYKSILEKNIFGFSNTAVKLENFKNVYLPSEIIAIDWWIFTLLLLNGCKGCFVSEAKTYYRQSANNLVGMVEKLNEKRLHLGIKVKINHYKNLKVYCNEKKLEKEKIIYNEKLAEMEELCEEIKNPIFKKKYIEVINKNFNKIYSGWWSEILSINGWRIYAE